MWDTSNSEVSGGQDLSRLLDSGGSLVGIQAANSNRGLVKQRGLEMRLASKETRALYSH
jgi:hypothetical protein